MKKKAIASQKKGETFVWNDSEVDLRGDVHTELLHQVLHMSRINRTDLISKPKKVSVVTLKCKKK